MINNKNIKCSKIFNFINSLHDSGFCSGRCGSTIVATMVNKLQSLDINCLSEMCVLTTLISYCKATGWAVSPDDPRTVKLVRTVLLLMTPCRKKKYFIKMLSSEILMASVIPKALPKSQSMFIYRSLKPTVNSFKRMWLTMEHKLDNMLDEILDVQLGRTDETFECKVPWIYAERRCKIDYIINYIVINHMITFMKATKGTPIPVLRYEDLITDSETLCTRILNKLGIPESYVSTAVKAIDQDAHGHSSVFNRNTQRELHIPEVSIESLEWGKSLAREHGLEIDGINYDFKNIYSQRI